MTIFHLGTRGRNEIWQDDAHVNLEPIAFKNFNLSNSKMVDGPYFVN